MTSQVSADYLGWLPALGLYGRRFADRAARDLLEKRRQRPLQLKRHRLEFGRRRLVVREIQRQDRAPPRAGRCPSIPVGDLAFAQQQEASGDPFVFVVIMLGFNAESLRSVHAHAWRGFDVAEVAEFVARLNKTLTSREHLARLRLRERELVAAGEIQPSGFFDADSTAQHWQQETHAPMHHQMHQQMHPQMHPQMHSQMHPQMHQQAGLDSVTQELKLRLQAAGSAPLLHPPRDYDTIHRSHGNVLLRSTEAPLRADSQAPTGAYIRRFGVPASQHAASCAGRPRDEQQEDEDEDEDEDEEDEDEEDELSGRSQSSSQRGLGASMNSSEFSAFSDQSADPGRGFATWRRRRQRQRLRIDDH